MSTHRTRRDVPPFRVIRELVRAARRRDEEARLVLHDALIERYGDLYLRFVRQAERGFVGVSRPTYVIVHPGLLRDREAWLKEVRRIQQAMTKAKAPVLSGMFSFEALEGKGPIPFEVVHWPMTHDVVTFTAIPQQMTAARDPKRKAHRRGKRRWSA